MFSPIRRLITLAMRAGSFESADAQGFGFTIGKTNSDIMVSYDGGGGVSYPDRESYTAGVTYRRHFGPGLDLQPEVLLVQRGWSERNHPTLQMTYVDFPLLLRLGAQSRKGSPLSLVLTAGPSFNFAVLCDLSNTDLAKKEGDGCGSQRVAFQRDTVRITRSIDSRSARCSDSAWKFGSPAELS